MAQAAKAKVAAKVAAKKAATKKAASKKAAAKKVAPKKAGMKAPPKKVAAAPKSGGRWKGPRAAEDGAGAFEGLRAVLAPHARDLVIQADNDEWYVLNSKKPSPYNKKPLLVGAVRHGKAYVSYYLFPLYMEPALAKTLTPELKKRMQGKSCFNFTAPDPTLFAQLAELTERGIDVFRTRDLI